MQWIAIVTMFIDHVGAVWFPDSPVWRLIGRLAFPIYAYYIAIGMSRTRSLRAYIRRLAFLAAASQLPFMLLFDTWTVNVIGTFLVSVIAIERMETTENPLLKWGWIAVASVLMTVIDFDYGAYGLLLIMLYRYSQGVAMWAGHLGMNALLWLQAPDTLQIWSVLPTFLFAFTFPSSGGNGLTGSAGGSPIYRLQAPRWLWRSFYPAHLAVLTIVSFWIGPNSLPF
ncbi:TraX family protein [Paenibacillus thermotolerans]|uniref:TraX family protein n=1 Tax=Paenibacillus thermotolerans TaxID=3027807 RepID=UPI002367DD3C|nr:MULTISPECIES: TraX family protein [unclassified Paenibacillus]